MRPGIELISGVEMNLSNPDTFIIPSLIEKESVRIGDYVKLGFTQLSVTPNSERMWVKVHGIGYGPHRFVGNLDNDPIIVQMTIGDKVEFSLDHILAIYPS